MRLRVPDWMVYALIVGGIWLWARGGSERAPAPPPPPERLGDLLPDQSPLDERVLVEVGEAADGTGTAFPINRRGTWMTARHVVDGCERVALAADRRLAAHVDQVGVNGQADVAVLRTRWNRPPLPSDLGTRKRVGEHGFFFGFPQGRPGEAVGRLLGRARLRVRGRYSTDEPVFAWAEIGRTAQLRGSLGGLSGAPVLDGDGEVVGVVSAENPRRGRIYTVAPVSLLESFRDPREAPEPIETVDYGTVADRYRRERRIVQVVCWTR